MHRVKFGVAIAAAAVACVFPLGAATAQTKHASDPRGDSFAGAAYDIVGLTVANKVHTVVTTFDMATLKPWRNVTLEVDAEYPGPRHQIFTFYTTRGRDRHIHTALFKAGPSAYQEIRVKCHVTASWSNKSNQVRLTVPQSCLPDIGRADFRAESAGEPFPQDPPDELVISVARG